MMLCSAPRVSDEEQMARQATMIIKGPLTGRHVLIGILTFFGVIFAVNGVMTYFALSTFSGLAVDDAYRKGLRYNQQIAAADAQTAKGWQGELIYRDGSGILSLTLVDKAELPLRNLRVEGVLGRPASAQEDRAIAFVQTGPGVYEATVGLLSGGQWSARLSAYQDSGTFPYIIERRLWVK